MADASESLSRTDESKTTAKSTKHPLDLDVTSSAGPYPRPRPPKRALRKIWLAAAGAAIFLGLTWGLFKEEPIPPPPPPTPPAPISPVTRPPVDSSPRLTEDVLDFAPVLDQPPFRPESSASSEPTADQPARAAAPPAKSTDQPAQEEPAPAVSADQPAQEEPAPAVSADQPAQAASPEKPTAGAEISDKWVVNISSTPDATESLRFLSALLGQDVGGRVYAYEVTIEGRLHHRIRVGFFDTREEAEAVGLKIKDIYQLYATPWAVRPSKEEENKYGSGL